MNKITFSTQKSQRSWFLMVALFFLSLTSWAQLSLPSGGTYTQDFDGLPTLPTGWTVRTGATSTSLGTAQTLTTNNSANNSWASASGNFRSAAATESPSASGDNATTQFGRTDRALGVRQGGSFGDPGAAFLLQLANTTGKTAFNLSLKHMVMDAQPRSTTYTVQYTTVAAGTSGWTDLGTFVTSVAWGATAGSYSFGTALDNIGNNVWIRVVALAASGGSGNRDTYGIDDVVLTWSETAPTIVVTPTISFSGTPVATDTYANTTNVTLATTTAGATIYYTTDGTDPTTSSTVYSAPFAVSTTTTIKAFAVASGLTDSAIATKTVTIVYPPANDLCANAVELFTNTAATNGTLAVASVTSPFTGGVDVWYKITPTYDETYTVTTSGFSGDVDVYLYNQSNACPTTTTFVTRAFTANSPEVFSSAMTTGVTYYIRVVADNVAAQNTFAIQVTSPVPAPVVTTTAATSIAVDGATLNGTVNANTLSTDITFEYGTTLAYGSSVAATPATLSTNTATPVSATVSSLSLNTLYNYRTVGTVSGTPTNGNNITFYTLAATPGVVVVSNPQLTTLDVTVNATTENANPSATQYAIQETTGGQYVQANGSLGATAVWQTAATWATVTVTGLANTTTYTFQAKARNGANVETAFGGTASGTTLTPATVDYNRIQFPNTTQTISEGGSVTVFARVYEAGITNLSGAQANLFGWIGYSSTNDNPANAGWTWVPATFNAEYGDDDEYNATIGAGLTPGTYYYAARFQIGAGPYAYGGTGGVWNNDSVTLNVNSNLVDFCNVQFPTTINITEGGSETVFAQVYEPSVTEAGGQGAGISAWIGYSTTNEAPNNTWTWISATYNTDSGNNDEYQATLGTGLAPGTYYYASRFQKTGSTEYQYGDINGVWNSTADNGVMTITGLATPTATVATAVDADSFVANWNAVSGAASYELDVYTTENGVGSNPASASWNFATASPNSVVGDVTVSALSQGNVNGTTTLIDNGSASSGYAGASGTNNAGIAARIGTLNTGASGSAYFQFSITPVSGESVTLTGISFGTRSTGTGPQAYTLRSSLDNYATDVATGTMTTGSWVLRSNSGLSVAGAADEVITFRLYGYNGAGSPGVNTANWRIDDLALTMSVSTVSSVTVYVLQNQNVGSVTSYEVTPLDEGTEYFYVVRAINGAVETANSNEIAVTTGFNAVTWTAGAWSNTTGPTSTIDAIIEDVYVTATNGEFEAKSLTINTGGSLTISTGDVVTVVGALNNTLTAAAVVVENNGVLMQDGTTNTNSGAITVRRNSSAILRQDYTAWSSPVANQGLYAFSPTTLPNRFYVYNTGTDQYSNAVGFNLTGLQYPSPLVAPNGINGTDQNNVPFATAKGYLIRTPWNHPTAATPFAGQFAGVPNSGNTTYAMTTGFNLVGNPYPSPISMTTFVADNQANITTSLYFWRETNGSTLNDAYCQWNDGIFQSNNEASVVDPNNVIRTGQGFFVEATATTNLVFNNDQRVPDTANQFFRQNNNQDVYWLNLTNTAGVFSQAVVSYKDYATNGIDRYDGKNVGTPAVVLASTIEGQEFGIQGKASFVDTDVVPMSFKVENAGTYTIAIDHAVGLFNSGQTIYLKDNLLSSLHNLTQGAYNFTTEAGSFANRFEVVYRDSALGVATPTLTEKQVVIYKNQTNDFVINTGNFEMSAVKVFDIRGRLLVERQAINASQTTITAGLSNEVLLVQITTVDGTVVTKKVIR